MSQFSPETVTGNSTEDMQRVPDMPELNRFFDGDGHEKLNFKEVVAALPKSVREMLSSGFEIKKLAKVFRGPGV